MVERQTAVKVSIGVLKAGEYVQKEGWTPNFIRTSLGEVSRANVMAVITQETEPGVYVVDDGTGSLSVRTFDEKTILAVGDPVMIIGRPRVYAGELFINYEILKKVDAKWLEFRKQELGNQPEQKVEERVSEAEEVVVKSPPENPFTKVIDLIRELDAGDGADLEAVVQKAGGEAERIVQNLLEEGEIFEIRPGRIKVLE